MFSGYTTIIPIEDILNPQSIVVLEIDNLPLKPEMGFPARLFVPHLYGWKSAKWLSELIFTRKYRSGYWGNAITIREGISSLRNGLKIKSLLNLKVTIKIIKELF